MMLRLFKQALYQQNFQISPQARIKHFKHCGRKTRAQRFQKSYRCFRFFGRI